MLPVDEADEVQRLALENDGILISPQDVADDDRLPSFIGGRSEIEVFAELGRIAGHVRVRRYFILFDRFIKSLRANFAI